MQNNDIDLVVGKPNEVEEKVATYTRFTLPFAFQLQAIAGMPEGSQLYYEPDNMDELSYTKRRKYFTRETADTLYERGQWLSVCDEWQTTLWGKEKITVSLRGQNFKIGMLAPQLILFEAPEIKHQDQRNILQTGLLYVDVYFSENQTPAPQLDDLLVLNEYFRYFAIHNDFHAGIFKHIFSMIPVNPEKDKTIGELPSMLKPHLKHWKSLPKIPIKWGLDGILKPYFERWATLLEIPIKYNNQYFQLFPDDWAENARKWMYNEPDSRKLEHWQIYADNRCYVWAVAFIKDGANALKDTFEAEKTAIYAKDYGHWVKLLNVDTPSFDYNDHDLLSAKDTHKGVSEFERQWADKRTYKRWEGWGTFFGFCYHGAAILAPPERFIFSPSATYYFDTTALLFYIRLSLFRFGRELSKVIQIECPTKKRKQLSELRSQFATFTVLYRFPMPSNQQQSIEMYEINRKYFDLDNFFEEVQQEIDNTHEFLETVEANKLASSANKLANWGIPLAAGGLLTALFSMSDLNFSACSFGGAECSLDTDKLLQAGLVVLTAFITFGGIKLIDKWKKDK